MNITTDEISAVWETLDMAVKQAVFIAVLERRNLTLEQDKADLRHTVEVLEKAVRGDELIVEH